MSSFHSASPPPLQHPVPTHPAYIPEPPLTPVSPPGYHRYSSSPASPQPPQHSHVHNLQSHPALFPQQHQPQLFSHPSAPNFAPWGMNDATAQFGLQLGQSAVAVGQDYVQKNFGGAIPFTVLKHHFNVSNSYVIRKLHLLLFPWIHKPWSRKMRRSEQGQTEWQSPRDDINSPDLYIPTMALVTYILLVALQSGLQGRFHPEVLGKSASRALAVLLLDFVFVKTGCYFLNIQGPSQIVDLISYGGYKFVGVILTVIAGLLELGSTIWGLVFLYAFLANAFFLLRSLRSVVLHDGNQSTAQVGTMNHAQRQRRIAFLLIEAVSQIVYMGILVRI